MIDQLYTEADESQYQDEEHFHDLIGNNDKHMVSFAAWAQKHFKLLKMKRQCWIL